MAIIINSVSADTFSINGITYNKIFQPLAMGTTNIALYNTYDTRFQLLGSTNFNEFVVDSTTYVSQALTIQALLPVIYMIGAGGGGGGGEWGTITGSLSAQTDLQAALDAKQSVGSFAAWADITGKPTTISGFGITDAYTSTFIDSNFALLSDARFLSTTQKTDLTDSGDSSLHFHSSDRARANHTGSQAISTITGLQTDLDTRALKTINLIAGTGITGGGTLLANRTFSFDTSFGDGRYLGINATAANSTLLGGFGISNISTINSVVQRDGQGDISTRLFRSEFDTTNPTVNFIMTQIDTAANNYIRPTTPAQFRSAVTDGFYLTTSSGKAVDSDLLDGIDSSQFLRSDVPDTKTFGSLAFSDNVQATFGSSADYRIYHDATNNYHDAYVGNTIFRDGTTTRITFFRTTGQISTNGPIYGSDFILQSDESRKMEVSTMDDRFLDIDWKSYKLKESPEEQRFGVIAQELEVKYPEFIRTDHEGKKSVAYIDLLVCKIAELENRIKNLEK